MAAIVREVSYHRNGVSGDPFYVALIDDSDEGLLVALMPEAAVESELGGGARCYVLGVDQLAQGVVAFVSNSYRGDHYHRLVREAAEAYAAGTFEPSLDVGASHPEVALAGLLAPRARPSDLAERVQGLAL